MKNFKEKLKNIYIIGTSSEKDWHRLLTLSFVIGLYIFIWSGFFFLQVQSDVPADSSNIAGVTAVTAGKEKDVSSLIDRYRQKSVYFEDLKNSKGSNVKVLTASTTSSTTKSTTSSSTPTSATTSISR